jgi:murein DD-endopeptidase MepM/ murein hydrolase activator NlpD
MKHRIARIAACTIATALALSTAACQVEPSEEVSEAAAPLTSPVAGAVAKPSTWTIVPPWASGVSHTVSQGYGVNLHQHTNATGNSNDHYALDLNLGLNEAVYPIASGTVTYAGPASGGWASYGNIVFLTHAVGGVNYQSLYAHLSSVSVTSGSSVTTGTIIGRAGNTGTSAVHLHLAVYKGASFSSAAGATGPYGGNAVVPEAFSSCTKSGGSCENLVYGNVLAKSAATCGSSCTQCVLGQRTDILPFYQSSGWDTSCPNRDAIVSNWCGLDPTGCVTAKSSTTCQASCIAAGSCGNACTACVLQQRTDLLPFYQSNGWDTSCGNRNAIVANWCSIDSTSCANVETSSACRSSCGL